MSMMRWALALSVLAPWPWYLLSAAAVGLVLVIVLDLPFRHPKRPGRSPLNRPPARI